MFDRKKYVHEHYLAHRDEYRQRSRISNKRQRERRKQTIMDAKSVPCVDCGIQYPSPVMQFDHVTGQKVANVADMINYGHARLLEEIKKCDIVCSNCHALRTMNRRQMREPLPERIGGGLQTR